MKKTSIALLWLVLGTATALAQVQSHQNQTVTKTLIQTYYKLTNTPSGNFITMPQGHQYQARVDATKPNGTHVISDTGLVVTNNPVFATVNITAGAGYWHFATEGELWCPVGQFGQILQTFQDWARWRKTVQCWAYNNGCQHQPGHYLGFYLPIQGCNDPLDGSCIATGQQGFETPDADPAPTCSAFVQTKYDFFEQSKDGNLSHQCTTLTKTSNANCTSGICGDYDP